MPRLSEYNDDNESDDGSPDAMMSIFASYYGIDDEDSTNKGGKKKGKSQEIDSAHFDSDEYVRDLLGNNIYITLFIIRLLIVSIRNDTNRTSCSTRFKYGS